MEEEIKEAKSAGAIIKEILKNLKGIKPKENPFLYRAISFAISILILLQSFQPIIVSHGWGFVTLPILLIVGGVILIVVFIFLMISGAGEITALFGSLSLVKLAMMLIIFGIIILVIMFMGSPELLKLIRVVWSTTSAKVGIQFLDGTTFAYIVLVILAIIIAVISFNLGSTGCFIFPIILAIILFVGIKPALAATGLNKYVSITKSVSVSYTVPSVTIPVGGGVSITYGTKETNYRPATLMAGEPYIYYYTIQNLYSEPEKFRIDPWIESRYQYATIRFKAPYQFKAPYRKELILNKSEFYQDQIYYDPKTMSIESPNQCYYTVAQITNYYDINESDIPCAYDKPCSNDKTVCVRTGSFMCDCLGWTGLTCGGSRAYMGMDVWHTGFLRANGTLYYKEEFFQPISNKRTKQGPLAVTPVFFPNPWVEKIHNQTVKNVTLSLEIENSGGSITITDAKAYPGNMEINTTVRGFSEDLGKMVEAKVTEKIGIDLLECKKINENIPSGTRIYTEFCTFSRPHVNITITDLTVGNITNSTSYNVEDIESYCQNGLANSINATKETKEYIQQIDKLIGQTGLCEALSSFSTSTGENVEEKSFAEVWKEKIKNSLKSVNVIIELKYEHSYTSSSRPIEIYTDTKKCLEWACCNGGKNMLCPEGWVPEEHGECKNIS